MQKEIVTIDEKKGVMRITLLNERWYARPTTDKITGLPTYEFLPSTTWICGMYPKGIGFYKWLAEKGWDEAEAIKNAAGDKGSKVHHACEDLDKGFPIDIRAAKYRNSEGKEEELTVAEVECLVSFLKWLEENKPQLLTSELTVFGDGYAGTIDRIYRIGEQIYIVDLKTAQSIWEEYYLQLSSYSHAEIDYVSLGITKDEWQKRKIAILQLGYQKNKAGYKFTELEDKYDLFKMAKAIWANENPDAKPKQRDIPLILEAQYLKVK